jgi:hypothetical protein
MPTAPRPSEPQSASRECPHRYWSRTNAATGIGTSAIRRWCERGTVPEIIGPSSTVDHIERAINSMRAFRAEIDRSITHLDELLVRERENNANQQTRP